MELRARLCGAGASTGALLLLTAATFALAACGGSGGGAPALHAGGHARAAESVPAQGSVTQSPDAINDVTANSVTATFAVSDMEPAPTIGGSEWRFDDAEVDERFTDQIAGTTWQTIQLHRAFGDGTLRQVVVSTDADPTNFDDDYLVMGYWSQVPTRSFDADGLLGDEHTLAVIVRAIENGAFANGGDPFDQDNILALTGTATFTGGATVAYIDTAGNKASSLTAAARLTATFGTDAELGTIAGRVDTYVRRSEGPLDPRDLTDAELAQLGPLTLASTDIGDSDSGFFTGNTSMTVDGDSLTGKWGGQFYGDDATPQDAPAAVAGAFGATDGAKAVIGTYGARR